MAEENEIKLMDSVKKLETGLYRMAGSLKQADALNKSIEDLLREAEAIERLCDESPESRKKLQAEIKARGILPLFKSFNESMNALKDRLDSFQKNAVKAGIFLENNRTYRNYWFGSLAKTASFIEKSLELAGITGIIFQPQFIGTIDLNALSNYLETEKKGGQIALSREKTGKLFSFIEETRMNKPFKLEAENIRFMFKSQSEIMVETKAENISKLDYLCRELEGKFSEN
ncbi:hypothetical protein HZB89_02360 [archaeon]|nr:hypothetical protein [archaeon]